MDPKAGGLSTSHPIGVTFFYFFFLSFFLDLDLSSSFLDLDTDLSHSILDLDLDFSSSLLDLDLDLGLSSSTGGFFFFLGILRSSFLEDLWDLDDFWDTSSSNY